MDNNFNGIDDEYEKDYTLASSKFDTQSNLASSITGGAIATVADFGTSVYNTLGSVIGAENVETETVLRKINKNALAVYEENPDTIQTLSLIGGSFVPGGLAIKGMQGIRAGIKGVNWFTEAGRVDNLAKIAKAAEAGVEGTAEVRALTRTMLRNGVANNVVDAAAMEVAMLGTMGAHPFLEDYWDNPVQNIGISLAFGGVLGGGLGFVADRAAIRAAKGAVETKAYSDILKGLDKGGPSAPLIGEMQALDSNIRFLDNIMKDSYDANPLTKQLAAAIKEEQMAKKVEVFHKATPDEFKALSVEDRNYIMDTLSKHPEFGSVKAVDGVKFYSPSDSSFAKLPRKISATKETNPSEVIKNKKRQVTGLTDSVYFPEEGVFAHIDDAAHMSRANTMYEATAIRKLQSLANVGKAGREDVGLLLRGGSSVDVDATYLSTMAEVHSKDLNSIKVVSPDDLPILDALVSRASKDITGAFDNRPFQLTTTKNVQEKVPSTNTLSMKATSVEEAAKKLGLPANAERTTIVEEARKAGYASLSIGDEVVNVPNPIPIVAKKAIISTSRPVYIDEIKRLAIEQKEMMIQSFAKQGRPAEFIAIRTNTPKETVLAYLTAKDKAANSLSKLEEQGMPIRHYDHGNVEAYLDPKLRPLRLTHSIGKLTYANMLSSLDQKNLSTINTEFIASILYKSDSKILQRFASTFLGNGHDRDGLRLAMEHIRTSVGEMNNNTLGNAFFQSADSFLRNTSQGKAITYIGKMIQNIAEDEGKKLKEPIANAMAKIAGDEAKLTEALIYLNLNDSLSGWRAVTGGQLVQKEDVQVAGKIVEREVPVKYQGVPFTIKSPEVLELVSALDSAGREAYAMKSSTNAITGRSAPNDIGHWVPSIDFRNKSIAYVFDRTNQRTSVIWGNGDEDLKIKIGQYLKATGLKGNEEIVTEKAINGTVDGVLVQTKAQQEQWNILKGRLDPLTMRIANTSMKKQGIAEATVELNTNRFTELLGAYDHLVEGYVKRNAAYLMHDTLDHLDTISGINNLYSKNQPLDNILGFLKKTPDSAAKVKNILLGSNNLNEYTPWKHTNENFEIVTSYGLGKVSEIFQAVASPVKTLAKVGKPSDYVDNMDKINYEMFSKKLAEAGVPNPFQVFDDATAAQLYKKGKLEEAPDVAKRMVYAGNAFAATMALRMLDLASPLVNIMSLPILTTMAKATNMPPKLLGAAKEAGLSPNLASIMHEGMRLSNSKIGEALAERWAKEGHFTSYVTESNKALRMTRSFQKDSAYYLESFVNNRFMDTMSWTADKAEDMIRYHTMFAGYALAKKVYPQLGDTGATIFARDFMDRAVGNYHSGQRPVMFQGTMGVAMGLFQTYMLTMAQNIYRHLELKDYKNLGKAMLAQSTIFGAGSLPGFDIVSQAIGDNFSDENIDLTTGTFRASDDKVATSVIFGLPANLGPALFTRGDISPRIPNPTNFNSIAAVNMVNQSAQAVSNVVSAVQEGKNFGSAALQALSLQSVSRPIARVSELATGYSISRAGDVFSAPSEVYTFNGIASRIMGARPIEEAIARESLHLDKTYARADREARMEVTGKLKKAIRNNELEDNDLEELAAAYMKKGGSAQGWRTAVNNALEGANTSGRQLVINKLRPDSPLMYMMDSLDGDAVE